MNWFPRTGLLLAVATAMMAMAAAPATAHGRWGGGGVFFGFAPPAFVPPAFVPPVFVAPPVYVAPYPYYRPYAAPPPYYAAPAASGGCYAGPYVCPLDGPPLAGAPCSCPANNGRVWGRAR